VGHPDETIEGPRGARRDEFEATVELGNNVFLLPDGSPRRLNVTHSLLWRPENHENMRIVLVNGQVVSHVGISEREYVALGNRVRVGFIGGVCTRADHRNRGFAGACLQDAIARLTRRGAALMPVSGRRTLYFRHHCACAGTRYCATLTRAQLAAGTPEGLAVRPYSEDMLDDLLRMYQTEPMRYVRSRDVFAVTMQRGSTEVVLAGGRPVAFVKYRLKEEEGGKKHAAIAELAGPRETIRDALVLWAQRDLWDTAYIGPLYGTDDAARVALRGIGVHVVREDSLAGTVRVVNFPLLMACMSDYFRERLGSDWDRLIYYEQDGQFVFGLGRERFELADRTQLALFMLGASQSKDDVEPPAGALGDLLRAVFPIPYVFPGSDSV